MTIRKANPRRKAGVFSRYWPLAAAIAYIVTMGGGLGTAVVLDQQAQPTSVVAKPAPVPAPEPPPIEVPAEPEPQPAPAPAPTERRGGIRPITGPTADVVADEAQRAGLDPVFMRVVAAIESSGNCSASTGSYHGLFQISHREFARRGGRGSIFNCRENARIAAMAFVEHITNFRFFHGREATWTELYLSHQQGPAGIAEHLKCPTCPAWQSMFRTAEYQRRGAKMARLAIWGNIPDADKARFGTVDRVTSADFIEIWRRKVEGDGPAVPVATAPTPRPRPAVVPNPKARAEAVPCIIVEGPGCTGAPILLPR